MIQLVWEERTTSTGKRDSTDESRTFDKVHLSSLLSPPFQPSYKAGITIPKGPPTWRPSPHQRLPRLRVRRAPRSTGTTRLEPRPRRCPILHEGST